MDLQGMIRDRGLKQAWIAAQIGLPEPLFSKIVRGMISLPSGKVRPLARILRVPAAELERVIAGEDS
jgi:predicted XRE-type DNA-binding protein